MPNEETPRPSAVPDEEAPTESAYKPMLLLAIPFILILLYGALN